MTFSCGSGRRNWRISTAHIPVGVAVEKVPRFASAAIRRGDHEPAAFSDSNSTLDRRLSLPDNSADERVYALPPDLILEPQTEYKISGWIQEQKKIIQLFGFNFRTGSDGRPVAY